MLWKLVPKILFKSVLVKKQQTVYYKALAVPILLESGLNAFSPKDSKVPKIIGSLSGIVTSTFPDEMM